MTTTKASSTSSTSSTESFQIPLEAAELYESAFVPGFFAQWAPMLCDLAGVAPGHHVLDVACGTGIVARTAADRVQPSGSVIGLDLNEAMLTVARRVRPDLDWRQGDAVHLPFPAASFDVVLCQMALMFMPDRAAAVREMARVVKPGGTVAIAVPGRLEDQTAFLPFAERAARLIGPEAMSLLSTYFVCGDTAELASLFESAGLQVAETRPVIGTYRAPSVDAAVTTEVEGTPLVDRISADTYRRLRQEAHEIWDPFTAADGSLETPFRTEFLVARRP